MSANLTAGASLLTNFGAERLYLFDDETLHTVDAVFFLETEVK